MFVLLMNRKVYWVDRVKDVMEVAELDGSLRKTLLHEGLFQPRGLVVDPREGLVVEILFHTL